MTDMQIWLADPLFGGAVQSGRHLVELLAAFGLTAIGQVGVTMTLSDTRISTATQVLADIDGVAAVLPGEDEPD